MASSFLPWLVAKKAGGQCQGLLWARHWLQACWQSLVVLMVVLLHSGSASVGDVVGDAAVDGGGSLL